VVIGWLDDVTVRPEYRRTLELRSNGPEFDARSGQVVSIRTDDCLETGKPS